MAMKPMQIAEKKMLPYFAFGPKADQKNVLIYAEDLWSAKQCALMLFRPSKANAGLVHVHLASETVN